MPTTVIYLGDVLGTVVEDIDSLTAEQLRQAIRTSGYSVVRDEVTDADDDDALTLVNTAHDPVQLREADHPLTVGEVDVNRNRLLAEAEAAVMAQCRRQLKELFYLSGRTPLSLTKMNDIFPSA